MRTPAHAVGGEGHKGTYISAERSEMAEEEEEEEEGLLGGSPPGEGKWWETVIGQQRHRRLTRDQLFESIFDGRSLAAKVCVLNPTP
jgi:hypothetical protein